MMDDAVAIDGGVAGEPVASPNYGVTLMAAAFEHRIPFSLDEIVQVNGGRPQSIKGLAEAEFEDPHAALRAARELVVTEEDDGAGKIALYTVEELALRADGSLTPAWRTVRRLVRQTHWGQVLVSGVTPDSLPTEELEFLGSRRLKLFTFADPIPVYAARNTPGALIPLLPLPLCCGPLRELHSSYGAAYRQALESGVSDFEALENLDVDDRERIRDRVVEASRVTARFDAWRQLPITLFDFLLAPVLLLTVCVWLVLMAAVSAGFVEFALSVVLSALGVLLVFSGAWVLGAQSDRGFVLWSAGIAAVTAFLLHGVVDTSSWPPSIMRTFNLTATTLVVAVGAIGLLAVAERVVVAWMQRQKLADVADEEVIDQLVVTLVAVREYEHSGRSREKRDVLIYMLEWLAMAIERRRPDTGGKNDGATRTWVRDTHREMGADVRRLKRLVLVPGPEEEGSLARSLTRMLVDASDGYWGRFGRSEAPPGPSRRARASVVLRGVAIAAFPLALVSIATLLPVTFDDQLRSSLTTASIGWAVVSVLGMLDPRAQERADALGKLINPLKSHAPTADGAPRHRP